jgi:hypothetical protein
MAHAAVHFAAGLAFGMAAGAPRLASHWRRSGGPLAPTVSRWLAGSWAAGLYALLPGVLDLAGLPGAFCDGWWMNVFVLHPLLNRLFPGGYVIGAGALGVLLAAQYGVVLAALVRARRRPMASEP